jgi:hypothetical protein
MVAKPHPETDAVGFDVLVKGMQFIVAREVHRLIAHHGEVVHPFVGVHGALNPLPINPRPHFAELTEIDFRIKVGCKKFPMLARVHVQNIDGVDLIEIVFERVSGVGVYHARVETDAQNRVNAFFCAAVAPFPLVVAIPRRIFTHLFRIFVNGGVHVGRAGANARFEHRHVYKRAAQVNNNLRFCFFD